MAAKAGQVIIDVLLNTAKFESDLKKVGKTFRAVGRDLTAAGTTLAKGVTVPIAAAGAAVYKFGTDFETAFQGVIKTVNGTSQQMAGLRKGILDMSSKIPVAATELSNIAEAAGQLGIKTESILDFTRVIADMGVSTNLSTEQAATALARLANITQMPQNQMSNLASTIVALGNAGASTESEIAEMGLRIAGAGNTVGMTMPQILGFANALSSVGLEADAGGSAISRVMVNMASEVEKGGAKLAAFGKVAGMTGSQFADLFKRDASMAITAFVEGLGKMKEAGGNVFATLQELDLNEIRVRDSLLRAAGAGDLFRESLTLGNQAWSENSALTKEASAFYQTVDNQFKMLVNTLKAVAVTLFDSLRPVIVESIIPAFKQLAEWLSGVAKWFADLPAPIQKTVVVVAALAAAIGPLLMALGAMATGIAAIIPILTGPAGIAIAIAAVGSALALWAANNQTVMSAVSAAWKWLKDSASAIWESLKQMISAVSDAISAIWQAHGDKIKLIFGTLWDVVKNIFSGALTAIKGIIVGALKVITGIIQTFHGLLTGDFKKMGEGLKNIVTGMWDAIKGIFSGAIQAVLGTVKDMYERVTGYFKGMYDKIVGHSYVPEMVKRIGAEFDKLPNLMITPTRFAVDSVQDLFSDLSQFISYTDLDGLVLDVDEALGRIPNSSGKAEDSMKDFSRSAGGSMNDLGQVVSTTLTNMTQDLSNRLTQWAGKFQSFASAALSSFMEGLVNPLMKALTNVGNAIGNWLSGLLTGKGGGFSLGNIFGGILGTGGTAAAGTAGGAAAATNAASGFMGPMLGGGGGAAAGGGGFMGSMGALFTNPWTIGIGAAAGAGYLGYKLATGPNSWQAGSEEAARDFKVELSDDTFQKLVESWGKQENQIWDIRKDLLSAPQTLVNVLAPLAEQQGKMGAFLTSLEKVQTAWGNFNFRPAFEQGMSTGDFSALNDIYTKAFSVSESLQKAMPDWQSKLLMVESATQASTDALLGSATVMDQNTIAITGNTDAIQKLIEYFSTVGYPGLTLGGDQASVPVMHSGTDYVPSDMLAYLQRGEQVIPAGENGTRNITIRGGDVSLHLIINGGGDDIVQTIKTKVIPILKREMGGGNSGLAEAVVKAYNRTAKAF